MSFDLAYSHLFVKRHADQHLRDVRQSVVRRRRRYIGDVNSHVDIISVALKYRWDDAGGAGAEVDSFTPRPSKRGSLIAIRKRPAATPAFFVVACAAV